MRMSTMAVMGLGLALAMGCGSGETAEPIEVVSESGAMLGTFEPEGAPRVGMHRFAAHFAPASGEHDGGGMHGGGAPVMRVEPWMPAHGHGSPSPVTVTSLGGPDFEMEVHFSMSGYWELTVYLTTGHGDEVFVVPVEVH
ncbi:MAG: FixH family protein [Myxococcota bacterium]|nr:FixH family protein [Myxococcota bacterium]